MVAITNSALEHFFLPIDSPNSQLLGIPVIDLSSPNSKEGIVRACEEFGFFKLTNHCISKELMARLETEAIKFFDLPQCDKESGGPPSPFGYGSRNIGPNGDVGWLEYLLLDINSSTTCNASLPTSFRSDLEEYTIAVRKLACDVLESIAEGLKIQPRNTFSKLLMDEQSDLMLRLNHYPARPTDLLGVNGGLTGFGEHTDPQILSVLRSNNTSGFQILRDGCWIPVPPDPESFFVNVGDSLQVLTNGRFRSVRHRVLASGSEARISMIFFGGPPSRERLAPLPLLMGKGERSIYREFTWFEYKKSAYKSRLADNRLGMFEKQEINAIAGI